MRAKYWCAYHEGLHIDDNADQDAHRETLSKAKGPNILVPSLVINMLLIQVRGKAQEQKNIDHRKALSQLLQSFVPAHSVCEFDSRTIPALSKGGEAFWFSFSGSPALPLCGCQCQCLHVSSACGQHQHSSATARIACYSGSG